MVSLMQAGIRLMIYFIFRGFNYFYLFIFAPFFEVKTNLEGIF